MDSMGSECLRLQFGTVSNTIGTQWLAMETDEEYETHLRKQNGKFRVLAFDAKHRIQRSTKKGMGENAGNVAESWRGNVQMYDQSAVSSSQVWQGLWNWNYLDEQNLFEISSFSSFMPLHNFYGGCSDSLGGNLHACDLYNSEDALRKYLEECDYLKNVECLVDMDSAWAGFAQKMMEYVMEECRTATIKTYANDYPYPLHEEDVQESQNRDKALSRRCINLASSVTNLSESSHQFIPLAMSSTSLPESRFPEWKINREDRCKLSHLVAVCLEAARPMKHAPSWPDARLKICDLAARYPATALSVMTHLSALCESESSSLLLPDIYSLFPASSYGTTQPNKVPPLRAQQIQVRGIVPKHFVQTIAYKLRSRNISFQISKTPLVASYKKFCADPIPLSISECRSSFAIATYLHQLGQQVLRSDRRVLYEYTQAGMSEDSIQELHDTLCTMSESFM